MATTIRKMGFFQWLAYTVHHAGLFPGDDWDEHVDSSPRFERQHYSPESPKSKDEKHKKKSKKEPTELPPLIAPEPVKDRSSKGVLCRGVWIDLSEDEDGCWLNTPYYVGIRADSMHYDSEGIHRCQTLNDVYSAAALGLLFPDELSARMFILELQNQNEKLNEEAEYVRSQSQADGRDGK